MNQCYLIKDNPKFFPLLKLFFPNANPETTVVTFGNKVYCKGDMPPDLWEHEITHCKQQGYNSISAMRWWQKYIVDKKFRFEQELEAYRNQYRYAKKHYSRNEAFKLLRRIAGDLSGPLYNNLVSYQEAYDLIQK